MEVTIHGDAETILKLLIERGEYPNADSAVNSLIVRGYANDSTTIDSPGRVPVPPIAYDEPFYIPAIPRTSATPVPVIEATERRLTDFLDVE
jgi:hypothetical protein